MAKNKTNETELSVTDFVNAVEDETKRKDSFELIELMREVTGFEPKMWGPTMIGFGSYHYKYESGHEGDMMMVGFSPRKAALTFYLHRDYPENETLMAKLGKYKPSKGCMYVKKLSDINLDVLREMTKLSFLAVKEKYGV